MKKITKSLLAVVSILLVFSVFAGGKHKKMMDMKKHFKKLDKNRDGKISKSEWMAKFKMIDSNGNGYISKHEMKEHHEMMMGKHKKSHKH